MISNTRAKAGGDFIVRKSDTFTIAACAFHISGSVGRRSKRARQRTGLLNEGSFSMMWSMFKLELKLR